MTGPDRIVPPRVVLASGSAIRRHLLEAAGVSLSVQPADLDEKAILAAVDAESSHAPVSHGQKAQCLADLKAQTVSRECSGTLVIGADQVLVFQDTVLSKPESRPEARSRLQLLNAATHRLISAVALAKDGEVVWRHRDQADLTMRDNSDRFLDRFVERHGESLLSSVGAYRLEDDGLQLFDRIEGDYHTILGLPLVALLGAMRAEGVLPS